MSIRPQRVAFINLHRGGMMHYCHGLAGNLLTAHPNTSVALFCQADEEPLPAQKGLVFFRYAMAQDLTLTGLIKLPGLAAVSAKIAADVIAWNPDVVHVNSGHISYPFFLKKIAQHFPMVSTIHDIHPHEGERRPFEPIKLNPLLKYSGRIVVLADVLKAQGQARWPHLADRFRVVPMPANIPRERIDTAVDSPVNEKRILCFGRIRAYKGYELVLAALPAILEKHPDARMVIAGQGSLQPWQEEIDRLADYIDIHNHFLADLEMDQLLQASSFVALPYREATQSGLVATAAAFSKTVVATRVGALEEAIDDGASGWLVPAGDVTDFAERCMALLDDPERCREMGGAAFEKYYSSAARLSLGQSLMDTYSELLDEQSSS